MNKEELEVLEHPFFFLNNLRKVEK